MRAGLLTARVRRAHARRVDEWRCNRRSGIHHSIHHLTDIYGSACCHLVLAGGINDSTSAQRTLKIARDGRE
jgi:hypothetical protein